MAKADRHSWQTVLKETLRSAGIPRGWSVSRSAGRVRLRVRTGAGGSAGSWSRTLPIEWEIGCIGPTTDLLTKLHAATAEGRTLDQAWHEASGEPATPPKPGAAVPTGIRWGVLAREFYRDRERNGTAIGAKTMAAEQRYVSAALRVLEQRNAPDTPYALISAAIEPWHETPRARKQAVEAIMRWLAYSVNHGDLNQRWLLTTAEKKQLVGKPAPRKEKATLTDAQILQLINSCPTSEWRTVLTLMATYGLRPEELHHLEVRTNHTTGKRQFWCRYEKASGQHKTKQRWLHPVPVRDSDDRDCFIHLVEAWDRGLLHLPPMADRGAAISQYLRRQPLWQEWRSTCSATGKVLKPYALRDSYSLRAHLRGIPSAQVAHAMGHSDQCHCANYVWATEDTTTAAFERLLQNQ